MSSWTFVPRCLSGLQPRRRQSVTLTTGRKPFASWKKDVARKRPRSGWGLVRNGNKHTVGCGLLLTTASTGLFPSAAVDNRYRRGAA